ncbi:MAG: hypothetical protein AAGL29_04025 [Bacteroidota bacterium]
MENLGAFSNYRISVILAFMKARIFIALGFISIGLAFSLIFFTQIEFPTEVRTYFRTGTYDKFGPLVISVEMVVAGASLLFSKSKANFALAIFGFTALLDPFFNLTGIFTSLVPTYATLVFVFCAIISLWIAFTDTFDTGRIKLFEVLKSFVLGTAIELFINNL